MTSSGDVVSDADIALYDRQIRLWGFDAQRRLQRSRVLLVELTGVQTEIAKNLVLAGVGHVTLLGSKPMQPRHLAAQFLLRCDDDDDDDEEKCREEAAVDRLRELNPRVDVCAERGGLFDEGRSLERYLSAFQLVCLSSVDSFSGAQLQQIDEACRRHRVTFVVADTAGMIGFAIADTHGHRYGQSGDSGCVHKCSSLASLLSADWSDWQRRSVSPLLAVILSYVAAEQRQWPDVAAAVAQLSAVCTARGVKNSRGVVVDELCAQFVSKIGREFSPVCAIVGGIVGQEIIRIVSGQEEPLPNVFLYNAHTSEGLNYAL